MESNNQKSTPSTSRKQQQSLDGKMIEKIITRTLETNHRLVKDESFNPNKKQIFEFWIHDSIMKVFKKWNDVNTLIKKKVSQLEALKRHMESGTYPTYMKLASYEPSISPALASNIPNDVIEHFRTLNKQYNDNLLKALHDLCEVELLQARNLINIEDVAINLRKELISKSLTLYPGKDNQIDEVVGKDITVQINNAIRYVDAQLRHRRARAHYSLLKEQEKIKEKEMKKQLAQQEAEMLTEEKTIQQLINKAVAEAMKNMKNNNHNTGKNQKSKKVSSGPKKTLSKGANKAGERSKIPNLKPKPKATTTYPKKNHKPKKKSDNGPNKFLNKNSSKKYTNSYKNNNGGKKNGNKKNNKYLKEQGRQSYLSQKILDAN